jgi:hypothetical protein
MGGQRASLPRLVPVLDCCELLPTSVLFWRLPCTLSEAQLIEKIGRTFGVRLALQFAELQENVLIIYALIAAVILLVAVTFISSFDFSRTRRR